MVNENQTPVETVEDNKNEVNGNAVAAKEGTKAGKPQPYNIFVLM